MARERGLWRRSFRALPSNPYRVDILAERPKQLENIDVAYKYSILIRHKYAANSSLHEFLDDFSNGGVGPNARYFWTHDFLNHEAGMPATEFGVYSGIRSICHVVFVLPVAKAAAGIEKICKICTAEMPISRPDSSVTGAVSKECLLRVSTALRTVAVCWIDTGFNPITFAAFNRLNATRRLLRESVVAMICWSSRTEFPVLKNPNNFCCNWLILILKLLSVVLSNLWMQITGRTTDSRGPCCHCIAIARHQVLPPGN